MGLGAGKWHIIRTIVLPCSIDGIVTGCILAVGRIVILCGCMAQSEEIREQVKKSYRMVDRWPGPSSPLRRRSEECSTQRAQNNWQAAA